MCVTAARPSFRCVQCVGPGSFLRDKFSKGQAFSLLPGSRPHRGGIILGVFDWFTVPVLACAIEERALKKR